MLYLASQSPRRAELLRQIGIKFDIIDGEIDETPIAHESPSETVARLSLQKALKGYQQLTEIQADDWVLASDTLIEIHDKVIGKPESTQQCRQILELLSGQEHQVLSAIALVGCKGEIHQTTSYNRIKFRNIRPEEIEQYCKLDEPRDKAGAYAIQGKAAIFIEYLEGSYSSVMGLPLYETAQLLQQVGFNLLDQEQI
jgi:septum formation protein